MGFEGKKNGTSSFNFEGGIDFSTASPAEIKAYIAWQEDRKKGKQMDPDTIRDIDEAIAEAQAILESK